MDKKMICYLDKTFCASPDCENDCGRKMTDSEELGIKDIPVCYAYFCGISDVILDFMNVNDKTD